METINKALLIGRLTTDPKLRFSQGSNMAVARFTLAVDKGYSRDKRDEMARQGKPTADFPRVVVFGRQAENCATMTGKGKRILVEGSIQTGSYTKQDGTKVYTTEVLANRVEFIDFASANQDRGQQDMNQERQQSVNQDTGDDFDTFSQVNDDEIPF